MHKRLPSNMRSIKHPLAQGQLNKVPAGSNVRMSWNKERHKPMMTPTILKPAISAWENHDKENSSGGR
jgi:hypothetical protein